MDKIISDKLQRNENQDTNISIRESTINTIPAWITDI